MTVFLALLSYNDKKNVVVFAHKKTTRSDLIKSFLVVYTAFVEIRGIEPLTF